MSADLATRQEAFLAAILDEGAPAPNGWGNSQAAGMAVYRGNYRGAASASFELAERLASESAAQPDVAALRRRADAYLAVLNALHLVRKSALPPV